MIKANKTGGRAPWHFWLICLIAVVWNGFGGYDYLMTKTQGDAYLSGMGMTAEQLAYYHAMPGWMTAVWAVGVWGAVAGSVLMLMRSRWAAHAFAASLAALLISLIYTYLLSNGGDLMGQMGAIMNGVITAAALFFLWYARRATSQGLLR